jgi:2-keto-4-pentenoate hydratase/2-oxohepta-3-ene-1,7-dioic acid hydratase in catechol pathway
MKIVSFSKIDGQIKMAMKGDSSLLVNSKPFFIPDWSNDVRMTPCVVLRVSRLGKSIGTKFATRYYDAVAPALNIYAADILAKGDWVQGLAFDYALPTGKFIERERNPWSDTIISLDEAVHRASEVMTIRQGDLIFIDRAIPSRALEREEMIIERIGDEELLLCKVK